LKSNYLLQYAKDPNYWLGSFAHLHLSILTFKMKFWKVRASGPLATPSALASNKSIGPPCDRANIARRAGILRAL